MDNLLRALYRGNVVFRIIRNVSFPSNGIHGGVPASPLRSGIAKNARGWRGATEIIFHVGRCEINNGQTRFDFPEVPVGPAAHYARRGKAHERDLLAAECYEQTSTKESRWLIIALTAAVTTMTRSGDDFSRWSESAINTPSR